MKRVKFTLVREFQVLFNIVNIGEEEKLEQDEPAESEDM